MPTISGRCEICGSPATVSDTRVLLGQTSSRVFCAIHGTDRMPALSRLKAAREKERLRLSCGAADVDEDIRGLVQELNRVPGIRTVCSCCGSHPGAGEGYVTLAPVEESMAALRRFIQEIRKRAEDADIAHRFRIEARFHHVSLRLADDAAPRQVWSALSRIVSTLR